MNDLQRQVQEAIDDLVESGAERGGTGVVSLTYRPANEVGETR